LARPFSTRSATKGSWGRITAGDRFCIHKL
jgi:hypothetical protein